MKQEKLTFEIAKYLWDYGVRNVFGVTGGASLHLLEAFEKVGNFSVVYNHHEQACAMAADAIWRLKGELSVCIATSGPGAMNLITGIASSHFDSIPILCLTGQVASFRSSEGTNVRQIGFQESDIVSMVRSITKFSKKVEKIEDTILDISNAINCAMDNRKGPVLIDIPDDFQRTMITPNSLKHPVAPKVTNKTQDAHKYNEAASLLSNILIDAERPIIVAGAGLRDGDGLNNITAIAEKYSSLIIPTWAVADSFSIDHEMVLNTAGTHGNRTSNLLLQRCDTLVVLGSRLDTHFTGSPAKDFAPNAKKYIIEIDDGEINKFEMLGIDIAYKFQGDASKLAMALSEIKLDDNQLTKSHQAKNKWLEFSNEVDSDLSYEPTRFVNDDLVNPYLFIYELGKKCPDDSIIISDTGSILAWTAQVFPFSGKQRFIHAFNNTPMGYAIPGTIAAVTSKPEHKVITLVGDGSFMMNIQELASFPHGGACPVIFVICNDGYAMIRQTQDQWFNSNYFGSGAKDLKFPDMQSISKSFGMEYMSIESNENLSEQIRKALKSSAPLLVEVKVNPNARVIPQLKFGFALDDMEPLVSEDIRSKYSIG